MMIIILATIINISVIKANTYLMLIVYPPLCLALYMHFSFIPKTRLCGRYYY